MVGDLTTHKPIHEMTPRELRALTASLPETERAAWGRVLEAARDHLKAMRKDYPKAFELACNVVHNGWHLGQVLAEGIAHEGGRPLKNAAQGQGFTLEDLGVNYRQSSRCQQLREKYASLNELDEYLQTLYDEIRYTLPSLRPAAEGPPIGRNTSNDEWYTPSKYLESARKAMGSIDLDPATSKAANVRVKASWFYTPVEDGLEQAWTGNVWLNPPFSRLLPFAEKLTTEATEGDVKQAVMLGPNFSDSAWWQLCAQHAGAVCHTNHRIRFISSATDEVSKDSPTNGHTFFYFGGNIDRFDREFAQWGIIR